MADMTWRWLGPGLTPEQLEAFLRTARCFPHPALACATTTPRCPLQHSVPAGRWRCHGSADFRCRGRWAHSACIEPHLPHWPNPAVPMLLLSEPLPEYERAANRAVVTLAQRVFSRADGPSRIHLFARHVAALFDREQPAAPAVEGSR